MSIPHIYLLVLKPLLDSIPYGRAKGDGKHVRVDSRYINKI